MNLNIEPIKNWFGFTRRERRSTSILLIIIILIIGFRYTIPDSRIAIEDITASASDVGMQADLSGTDSTMADKTIYSGPGSGGRVTQYTNYKKGSQYKKKDYEQSGPVSNFKRSLYQKEDVHSTKQRSRIDLNLSDSSELVKLPGIGPVLAARIVKYRRLLGGFATVDQLQEVYGLQAETYEINRERVVADSSVIKRIDINSAGYKELCRIHYFEKYEISSILKYRELKGKIRGIADLTENKLITKDKANRVRPYLKFEN